NRVMALKRTVPLFLVAVVAVALTTLQGADAATFPTVCTCHYDPIMGSSKICAN
ncbi:hypothetical protein BG003_011332, partial [Podila horticola]